MGGARGWCHMPFCTLLFSPGIAKLHFFFISRYLNCPYVLCQNALFFYCGFTVSVVNSVSVCLGVLPILAYMGVFLCMQFSFNFSELNAIFTVVSSLVYEQLFIQNSLRQLYPLCPAQRFKTVSPMFCVFLLCFHTS